MGRQILEKNSLWRSTRSTSFVSTPIWRRFEQVRESLAVHEIDLRNAVARGLLPGVSGIPAAGDVDALVVEPCIALGSPGSPLARLSPCSVYIARAPEGQDVVMMFTYAQKVDPASPLFPTTSTWEKPQAEQQLSSQPSNAGASMLGDVHEVRSANRRQRTARVPRWRVRRLRSSISSLVAGDTCAFRLAQLRRVADA